MKQSELGTAIAIMSGDSGPQPAISPPSEDFRITEDSDFRITENGDNRIIE